MNFDQGIRDFRRRFAYLSHFLSFTDVVFPLRVLKSMAGFLRLFVDPCIQVSDANRIMAHLCQSIRYN